MTFRPNRGMSGQHSVAISGEGKDISFKTMMAVANLASIPKKEVSEMIEHISDSPSQWSRLAKDLSVPNESINEIKRYIANATRYVRPRLYRASEV